MNHRDAEMSAIVVVLEELDDEQTLVVVEALKEMGMSIDRVDNDESVIEGTILSQKVRGLEKVSRVRYVRSTMTYTADYPCDDPRDCDGVEDACDESAD